MRKVILILMALVVTNHVISQTQPENIKVTLNNGKEIVGKAKTIDLKESITLTIGGIDVSIDMNDVAKMETIEAPKLSLDSPFKKSKDKFLVTDTDEYPDSFVISIGVQNVKMRLVRGGDMLMGFDGDHSWAMCSEPVHKVSLTSFYMSDVYIREGLFGKTDTDNNLMKTHDWKEVDKYVKVISNALNLPLRLPTEAEWEYSTYSSYQSEIFRYFRESEWCSDFFDDYDDFIENDSDVDPTGPVKGKYHVIRSIDAPYGKLDRSLSNPNATNTINDETTTFEDKYRHAYFRLVIKAKDYLHNISNVK